MRQEDDDNYNYNRGSQTPVLKTASELRNQYKQNLNKLGDLHVETDENGNATIMGVSVPKNLKPALEIGLQNFKPWLIEQSDKVYHNTAKLATRIGFKGKSATTAGAVVENTFRWGVIGIQQILDAVKASSKYTKDRKELFRMFAPVMHATGANIRNNEVIKVAFDEIHQDWVSDMKSMAADLPTLTLMVMLGLQDQKLVKEKRANVQALGSEQLADIEAKLKVQEARAHENIKFQENLDRIIEERKQKYIEEKTKAKIQDYVKDRDENGRIVPRADKVLRDLTPSEIAEKFDRDVAPQLRNAMDNHDRGRNRHHDEDEHKEDKSKENMLRWMIAPASILTEIFRHNITENADKRRKRVRAWKMIEHIKEEMETQCGKVNGRESKDEYGRCDRDFTSRPADEISVSGIGNKEGENISLKEYIVEIFQQHERDRQPSRNFRDKSGKLIDPLKGTLLANLQPAIDLIAEHIADGSLSADALYKLVGENKIIVHSRSGAKTFANAANVRDVIEKELVPVLSTREVIKLEEFLAKFADPALIQQTLKKNLETMKGQEKALFASLFPDDILLQAGMKKKDIEAARKQSHEYLYDFVASNTLYLAAKDPSKLKERGVSDKEIEAIAALAEKIESGDMKAVKSAVDGRDKEIVDAVRTAAVLEQVGGDKAYWTTRVREIASVHNKLKENETKHKQEENPAGSDKSVNDRNDSSWKPERENGRGSDDKWASEKSGSNFSDRLNPDRDMSSATGRVQKRRDAVANDAWDLGAV